MTVTAADICNTLGITETQVYMAIYSGYLPNPNEYNEWDLAEISYLLDHWQQKINARKNR